MATSSSRMPTASASTASATIVGILAVASTAWVAAAVAAGTVVPSSRAVCAAETRPSATTLLFVPTVMTTVSATLKVVPGVYPGSAVASAAVFTSTVVVAPRPATVSSSDSLARVTSRPRAGSPLRVSLPKYSHGSVS